jgi:ribosome-binding protein aMBF1 (putative translation factor)
VPETRGTSVVVLAPITVDAPLPDGFIDIDALVEQEEKDPATKQAIAVGRVAIAENHYSAHRPLAYYRLQNGWSQKELAMRMGTSQSYIARLEAGDIDPQVSTLKRLAAVFDVKPALLLDALATGVNRS